MGKEHDRQRIARDVEAFLASGGKIEVIETKRVVPDHMKWIARRGMDYQVWDEIGGEDWYRREGDFPLDPEDFEED